MAISKSDLVSRLAEKTGSSQSAAGEQVDALFDIMGSALKDGEDVAVAGFGKLVVRERAARKGRNPKTGETIAIDASKTVGFKVGKTLKDAINA